MRQALHAYRLVFNAVAVGHSAEDKEMTRTMRRQVFHTCLYEMLTGLREGMKKPVIMCCPDGRFRRVVFGLGPYIADYPEQLLVTCVRQDWCCRCVLLHFC